MTSREGSKTGGAGEGGEEEGEEREAEEVKKDHVKGFTFGVEELSEPRAVQGDTVRGGALFRMLRELDVVMPPVTMAKIARAAFTTHLPPRSEPRVSGDASFAPKRPTACCCPVLCVGLPPATP